MGNVFRPGVNPEAGFRRAVKAGYSMQNPFIDPAIGAEISRELDAEGYLHDYTELIPTQLFRNRDTPFCNWLHRTINGTLSKIDNRRGNRIPLFSVRVFEPGLHGTTIHRNDPCIGPWAVGVTLKGQAPFNVYRQDQLPGYAVRPLVGDGTDPIPMDTMDASAGTAWTLYTAKEQMPHSSGIVASDERRELLIFYGSQY